MKPKFGREPKSNRPRKLVPLAGLAATMLLAACGGGGDEEPEPPPVPAANCQSLTSGAYRLVLRAQPGAAAPVREVEIDAAALKMSVGTQSVGLQADGACRYQLSTGGEMVVTKAGVATLRYPTEDGVMRAALLLPRQDLRVEDMAGSWNAVGVDATGRTPDIRGAVVRSMAVAADGRITAATACTGDEYFTTLDCAATAVAGEALRAEGAGAFRVVTANGADTGQRLYAYRAADGGRMWVQVDAAGSFVVGTPVRPMELPAVVNTDPQPNPALRPDFTALGLALAPDFTAPVPMDLYRSVVVRTFPSEGFYGQWASAARVPTGPGIGFDAALYVYAPVKVNSPLPGMALRSADIQAGYSDFRVVDGVFTSTLGFSAAGVTLPVTSLDLVVQMQMSYYEPASRLSLLATPGP